MSAPFVIPFNHNPASTTIKTASYTVPSGKYVRVNCLNPFLTVNGVDTHKIMTATLAVTAAATVTASYPLPEYSFISSYSITRSGSASGASTITVSQKSENETATWDEFLQTRSAIGTSSGTNITVGSSRAFLFFNNISGNVSATGSSTITIFYANNLIKDIWFPSGTVLNGFSFIVEEYNQIS